MKWSWINPTILPLLLFLSSCLINEDPTPTNSDLVVTRGDIIVASLNADAVVSFSADGTFKRNLYQTTIASEAIGGLGWNADTNEILITINGTPDRIDAVSAATGAVRSFYSNTGFYTGTPLGVVQLASGDIIASEGTTIERFSASGVRQVYGSIWPTGTGIHQNVQQMRTLSTGNWLSCSSNQGVRIFPDSTTSLASVATVTAPTGATAAYGCDELSDGTIVVSWSGGSDFITTYSATLTSPTNIVNNVASTLPNPQGLAVGENDQIYVADGTLNRVVELDTSGNVIRQFGMGVLNAPRAIMVVPAFSP